MKPKVTRLILDNHVRFEYEFNDIKQALDKLTAFKRYKSRFKKRNPTARFKISFNAQIDKQTLIVEIWTFPKLLKN